MKKERLDILFDLYSDAKENNSLQAGTIFSVEDLACGGLDMEYLDDGGYVRVGGGMVVKINIPPPITSVYILD
jgi:hypothetical protein